LHINMCEPI